MKQITLCACGNQATVFEEDMGWCDSCAEEADAKGYAAYEASLEEELI